jgi:hypothetical protein
MAAEAVVTATVVTNAVTTVIVKSVIESTDILVVFIMFNFPCAPFLNAEVK